MITEEEKGVCGRCGEPLQGREEVAVLLRGLWNSKEQRIEIVQLEGSRFTYHKKCFRKLLKKEDD